MKLHWGWISGVAAVAAIVPSFGLGQQGSPASARPTVAGERVVLAEVRESRCRDGTRSVRVQLLDAGEQPVEVVVVDAQGFVHTYVLSAQPRRPLATDRGCTLTWPQRGPVFPWY